MLVMWNKTTKKNLVRKKNQVYKQLKNFWEEDTFYVKTISSFVYQKWVCVEQFLKPLRRRALDISILAFVAVIGTYVFFPTVANADVEQQIGFDRETVERVVAFMQNKTEPYGRLPQAKNTVPRRTYSIPLTAYTSEPAQTDSTPCITASGLDVCERDIENVVAANFLPLGTRVRIPELFGDRVFYVEDRMNKRYQYKMDVWMKEKATAKTFGLQHATIEVF